MQINTKLKDGQWFKFNETVDLKIRSFPLENIALLSDEAFNHVQVLGMKVCEYCLCDWKGLKGEDGSEFKYTEDNKKYLLNFYSDIVEFVKLSAEDLKKVKPLTVKETSKK